MFPDRGRGYVCFQFPHRKGSLMSHIRALAAVSGLLGLTVLAATPAIGATAAPKKLSNPTKTCAQLTARFQKYLSAGMDAQLAQFVSPAFVIERNDGTTGSWPSYLAEHPTFTGWNIAVVSAQFSSPAITCVAITSTTQLVDGVSVVSVPTNNMSTYVWQRGAWRITSYARFNSVS